MIKYSSSLSLSLSSPSLLPPSPLPLSSHPLFSLSPPTLSSPSLLPPSPLPLSSHPLPCLSLLPPSSPLPSLSDHLFPFPYTSAAAPRFTMKPNDLDLKMGNTATISCAFNGQPAPSVVWRKDSDIVTSDERRKITSCATSSVLEIVSLEYEDEGVYSCYATNQLGSDSASLTLSLHGT